MGEKKRGRPPKNDEEKKTIGYHLRMTKEDRERLKKVSKMLKRSEADTIRILVEEAENILQNR